MFTICQPWEIPTSFSLCLHQSSKTVRTTTSNLTGHAPRWLVRIFFLCVCVCHCYRVNRNMQNREAAIPAAIFISRPASWPRFSPARPDSFPGFIMYLYLIRSASDDSSLFVVAWGFHVQTAGIVKPAGPSLISYSNVLFLRRLYRVSI